MMKQLALFILLAVAPACVADTTSVSSNASQLAFDTEEAPPPPDTRSYSCLTKEGSTCKGSCDLTKMINGKQCTLEELHTAGANSPARQCYYEPAASISCYYACDDQIGLERILVGCAVDDDGFDALTRSFDEAP